MIQVKYNKVTDEVEVSFKYCEEYVSRIKRIPGVKFDGEQKLWKLPSFMLDGLDNEFKGEMIYLTPKWEITGEPPPDYFKIYSHVPNKQVDLKPPYKPYPFQLFGANFLVEEAKRFGMSCLFDDMGTGKTIQSISASLILNDEVNLLKHAIPTLVVCKSGLKFQWQTDGIDKFTNATSVVVDGTKAKRKKIYDEIKKNPGCYEYVIIGYETIREDIDILEGIDIGLVISDEAHKIRNKDTQVNKACAKIKAKYYFFLTGSPISSKPDEIFGLGNVGNKKFFGSWKEFSKEYLRYRSTQFGPDLFGYQNLDKLRAKIDSISLRRTDKEVEMQMPKIIEQDIPIKMTKVQSAIDEALNVKFIDYTMKLEATNLIKDPDKRIAEKTAIEGALQGLLALRIGCADSPELFLMSNSPSVVNAYGPLVTDKKSGKLDHLKDHVQEIVDSGNKVVIFTKFETMTRIIERELNSITGVVTYTGKKNAREKEDARIKFKTNSNFNVFVATNAGAEGLNLQEAKYLINFDLDWDIGINDQRNKRIRRLDSTFDKVYVYNYVAVGSADELVKAALEKKKNLFSYLIENNDAQSEQMKMAMRR